MPVTVTPDLLLRARLRLNYSQVEIGAALGVSGVTWGRWERGEVQPEHPPMLLYALGERRGIRLCDAGADLLHQLLQRQPDLHRVESIGIRQENIGALRDDVGEKDRGATAGDIGGEAVRRESQFAAKIRRALPEKVRGDSRQHIAEGDDDFARRSLRIR